MVLSSVLLVGGIVLTVYSFFGKSQNLDAIIVDAIERGEVAEPFKGQRNAVYLVKDVNNSCRRCSRYDTLKKDSTAKIVFYVDEGFSDNDIDNFRDAFRIPEKYKVERIPDTWQYLYQSCIRGDEREPNLLILINEHRKVTKVWRF